MIITSQIVKNWLKPADSGVIGDRKNHQLANKIFQVEIYAQQNPFASKIQEFKTDSSLSQFPWDSWA